MEWYEALKKYCNICERKDVCHTPCPLVNAAIWDLPCVKDLERMCGFND